jgi:hypothetical protein
MIDHQRSWPTLAVLGVVSLAALIHGPIQQLSHYHDFADQSLRFGIPHFADVASNIGFVIVGLWGMSRLRHGHGRPALVSGWAGYRLFLVGLLMTGFGSAFYHLDPDNARLVWDRMPIAVTCGGLLAGIWGDTHSRDVRNLAAWLSLAGVASVAWWHFTGIAGAGDLRPYLLLQILPMLLIPLWHWQHRAVIAERLPIHLALVLYVMAKLAELYDHEIAQAAAISGHTLKHLLATLAASAVVGGLVWRTRLCAPKVLAIPA